MKQLLSIILLLAAIIPDSILAMERPGSPLYPVISPSSSSSSSSSSGAYPSYPDPFPNAHVGAKLEEINPVRIDPISNPLRSETIAHVEKCSRGSALLGALLGGCATGSYVQRYYTNLSPIEKIGITGAGSAFSGLTSYFAAQWFTTRRTAEKQDEATFNEFADLNNAAFAAKCNLDANTRSNLNFLIEQQGHLDPIKRTAVYHYALNLHQPKQAREYPIGGAVEYLESKTII
jgi:hypothetical protein